MDFTNYNYQYISDMGDEYAQKEKDMQSMIASVRKKSEMLRKKKLNSVYRGKAYADRDDKKSLLEH